MADQCQVVKTWTQSYRRVLTWFVGRWRNHQPKRAEKPHSKFSVVRRWTALLRGRRLRLPWRIASGSRQPPKGERPMSARERELGELPSPNLSLLDRKVGQGLIVFRGEHPTLNLRRPTPTLFGVRAGRLDDRCWMFSDHSVVQSATIKSACPRSAFGQNLHTNEPNAAKLTLWDAYTITSWKPSGTRLSSG